MNINTCESYVTTLRTLWRDMRVWLAMTREFEYNIHVTTREK